MKLKWLMFPAVIGGSALLADGLITPSISVSSAVEGLRYFNPDLPILLIVVIILFLLFFIQQFGSSFIGKFFGPMMLVWFSMIGMLGIHQLWGHLEILKAINPYYGYNLLVNYPKGFWLLGFGYFTCGFQIVFIGTHLPAFLLDQGLTATDGTIALALIGLFNIVGSWGAG